MAERAEPTMRSWPAAAIVYRDEARTVTAATLAVLVQRLADALPAPGPGTQVAFAFEQDVLAYLVAVLAVWQRGHAVALPLDARRHAVGLVLAQPEVVAFVHDTGAGRGLCVPDLLQAWLPGLLASTMASMPATAAAPWTPRCGRVVHCTPTGRETLARETSDAAQLLHECAALQQRWPLAAGQTLAHACRPGARAALVPGLLWPLVAGATLRGGLVDAATAPVLPARALAQVWLGTTPFWQQASRHCAAGRAAAGEPPSLALVLEDWVDHPSRQRLRHAGIELQALAAAPAADAAALALTAAAYAHGAVDVALLRCHAPGEAAPRLFGLLVPPANAGPQWLAGLMSLPTEVPILMETLPPVLATAAALPRCADGRVAPAVLLQALDRLPDARLPVRQLAFAALPLPATATANTGYAASTVVPADYYAFSGHFDGYPVLSGAVQLHDLVLPVLRAWLGNSVQPAQFLELKFLARIGPGAAVEVRLQPAANGRGIEFAILQGTLRYTSGRLLLRENATA